MNRSLRNQFLLLEAAGGGVLRDSGFLLPVTGSLPCGPQYEKPDIELITGYFSGGFDVSMLEGKARALFELSSNAFDLFLHAWLSELPIEAEIAGFGGKVLAAAEGVNGLEQKRLAAQRAESDRGDSDTLAVLKAAYKVQHETDKMMGLLRFFPDTEGKYTARCAPDHFILPALAGYFTARFGEISWSIIDEKRKLCLRRHRAGTPELVSEEILAADGHDSGGDEWEELWKHYHKTINNEQRNNPCLQRQLMPQRYWKYLPEM